MTTDRRWALILGASSGFGAATARELAAAGHDIVGVHLDRRSGMAAVEALVADLAATGREVRFFNQNAADDGARRAMVGEIGALLGERGGRVDVFVHSLAFGTLRPLAATEARPVSRSQLEMTLDVMAHSLVYWVQDLLAADLLRIGPPGGGPGGARVFAMTSSGSHLALPEYGPVAAAKAALESYVRQLCLELAPHGIAVNALMAGVTRTPALEKIPRHGEIMARAATQNPHGRLTLPEDVARAIVALSRPEAYWINGNTIRVDGGESFCA